MLLLVNSLLFSLCFYQEIAADESLVKKAGTYLVDVVLLKFVQDLRSLEVSPMDGKTLTEALHAHGINMRYIGKVSERSESPLDVISNLNFQCFLAWNW